MEDGIPWGFQGLPGRSTSAAILNESAIYQDFGLIARVGSWRPQRDSNPCFGLERSRCKTPQNRWKPGMLSKTQHVVEAKACHTTINQSHRFGAYNGHKNGTVAPVILFRRRRLNEWGEGTGSLRMAK